MRLIVGLGNPGKEYQETRHNVGFIVVERLSQKMEDGKWENKEKFKAEVCQMGDILLVKPQTFMNASGEAVAKIASFYKVKPEDIYLIHDDLDLQLGEYKIQLSKGPQRHNGVLSVEKELETKGFWRARIGIAKPEEERKECLLSGKDYVLAKFNKKEKEILDQVADKVMTQLLKDVVK